MKTLVFIALAWMAFCLGVYVGASYEVHRTDAPPAHWQWVQPRHQFYVEVP